MVTIRTPPPRVFFLPLMFLPLMFLPLAASCSKEAIEKKNASPAETAPGETVRQSPPGTAWPALALLKIGYNPLWFELGEDGPVLIDSPAAAGLAPFTPWPHAVHITGIQEWKGFLVMAVNRDGFLVLGCGANPAEAVLYRVSCGGLWKPYTAESLFMWDGKPAVLLYRNDFFAALNPPPPEPRVYLLDESSPEPLAARIPALEHFPPGGPWEVEVLLRGPDDLWYYRVREKGKERNETVYFRTDDLSKEGRLISVEEWRNANRPRIPSTSTESLRNLPPCFTAVLNATAGLELGGPVCLVSEEFGGDYVVAGAAGGSRLYGYCRETGGALAFILHPDGRLLYASAEENGIKSFSLPGLPEGFVYTGAALLNDALLVAWEEQETPAVGAAGFMVMRFPPDAMPEK